MAKQVIPLLSPISPYPIIKYLTEDELYKLLRAKRAALSRQGKARRAFLLIRPEDELVVSGMREKIFRASKMIVWETICPQTGAKGPRHRLTGRELEAYNEVGLQELVNDSLFSTRKFRPRGAIDEEVT